MWPSNRICPVLAAAALLWLGCGLSAKAELVVCNASEKPIRLARAEMDEAGTPTYAFGMGELGPSQCDMMADPLARVFYLYSAEPGFVGETVRLCINEDPYFYMVLPEGCHAPGDAEADYRRIELPPDRKLVVLNLDGAGGYLPEPDLPFIDASKPFAPPHPGGQAPEKGGAEGPQIAAVFESGLEPGAYGQPFQIEALWQGCAAQDSGLTCEFHGEMVKFLAADGAAYPQDFLPALAEIPPWSAVSVLGDVLDDRGAEVHVALGRIELHAENPFYGLIEALQGHWINESAARDILELRGVEFLFWSDGELVLQSSPKFGLGCPGSDGDLPSLSLYREDLGRSLCAEILALSDSHLRLSYDGYEESYRRD